MCPCNSRDPGSPNAGTLRASLAIEARKARHSTEWPGDNSADASPSRKPSSSPLANARWVVVGLRWSSGLCAPVDCGDFNQYRWSGRTGHGVRLEAFCGRLRLIRRASHQDRSDELPPSTPQRALGRSGGAAARSGRGGGDRLRNFGMRRLAHRNSILLGTALEERSGLSADGALALG